MEQRSEQANRIVPADRVAITAVVATHNEERHIGDCLCTLLAQQGVNGEIEILVVDGMSTDRTVDIVRSFPEFGSRIRLIKNPGRLQVYAWNAAIREARGEYFAMIIAHAKYHPTYFASCLEVMRSTGAAAVGGVQRPVGSGRLGTAIAWCMASPLGMGNARFRYTTQEEESQTVFSIFTRVETLRAVGGYDERVPFDEDSDMNYRLRESGKKLVTSPKIRVSYFVRSSVRALFKQMYRYGYWRRFTQLKHGRVMPLRVYAPAVLVAAFAAAAVLAATPLRLYALSVPVLYALFLVGAALLAVRRIGFKALYVPAALAIMHISYGLGFWTAFFTMRSPRRDMPARTLAR